ncbi:hypothetical protein N411_03310 [Helicobacter pylori FD535]|nr:hypothetical protein N411_03310 [Helicobacter pylori FD535]
MYFYDQIVKSLSFNQAVIFKRSFGVRGFLVGGCRGELFQNAPPILLRKWVLLKK